MSSKFDPSTSPDRPPCSSGMRGLSAETPLEKSGSFRESMESPILSPVPSMSRSSLRVTHGDIESYFQCLHFDTKSVGLENKFQRLGEFKRVVNAVLGYLQDDTSSSTLKGRLLSSFSHEDLIKVKAALRESSNEARERSRIFGEALSVFKKFFPGIPLRKRSRMDTISSDRANMVSLNDRSGLGPRATKMGSRGHAMANAPRVEQQRSEERTKNTKRKRTSLLDARANTHARQSSLLDMDRGVARSANSSAVLANDRRLPIESWERSKMKKKRSGTKADVSPSASSVKSVDGHRELKQGMRQGLSTQSVGFRSGISNGAAGIKKLGDRLRQTVSGPRSCIARVDHEHVAAVGNDKERPSNKERVNLKTVNKTNVREEYSSPSPSSNAKFIASARAPPSCSGTLPKMSPGPQQPASSDWEISKCTFRPLRASGPTNRKRTPSARSSSPPVGHLAGQGPQKISRTARRANFLPIFTSNDEAPSFDVMSDVGSDSSFISSKHLGDTSTPPVKRKNEQLSESEESAVAEIKRQKKKKLSKADGRAGHNVKRGSSFSLPVQKNELNGGEELGDGVRRQGRTCRSLKSSGSLMPMTADKLGLVTAKQPRTTRNGLDKADRKAGRPPMRKPSDRKAFTRNKLSAVHISADFGDDGQDELVAAAKAVADPSYLSLFWRHMEMICRFTSEVDIDFLKQQDEAMSISETPSLSTFDDANAAAHCHNGFAIAKKLADAGLIDSPEQSMNEATVQQTIPLCQRLIASLVTDEEEYGNGGNEEVPPSFYEPGFQFDAAMECASTSHGSMHNTYPAIGIASNGCGATLGGGSLDDLEGKLEHESPMVSVQKLGGISSTGYLFDGLRGSVIIDNRETVESQYPKMSFSERVLLEIQSIGIYPEQSEMGEMDNEDVSQQIRHMDEEYHRLVSKKRSFIPKLLKSALQSRELQEYDFEQCALEKLVSMAYEKYMASFGGRGASSKMMRQAALAFVNRTLEHCRRYEATGISCFRESLFKDIFNTMLNKLTENQSVEPVTEKESGRDPHLALQQIGQHVQTREVCSSNQLLHEFSSDQNIGRPDGWSNTVKKRDSLDVCSSAVVSSGDPPVTGGPILSSTKGKRMDRDRDGKSQGGNIVPRNVTAKSARSAVGKTNGDRRTKGKAKQKATQLSSAVDGFLGKNSAETRAPFASLPNENITDNSARQKEDLGTDGMNDPVGDFSSLQVPEMDVDIGGQEQDLASWLNIDDDSFQDHDFMGLEIPMDDLTDVNMMF